MTTLLKHSLSTIDDHSHLSTIKTVVVMHLSAISSLMLETVEFIKIKIFLLSPMMLQAMLAVDSFRFLEPLRRLRAAIVAWANEAMKALFISRIVRLTARITHYLERPIQVEAANRLPSRLSIGWCPRRSQTQATIARLRHLGASNIVSIKCPQTTKTAQNRVIKAPNWLSPSQRSYQASSCITRRQRTALS